jgi:hypothetical protein
MMKVFVSYPSSISWTIQEIFRHLPSETIEPWIDDRQIPFGSRIEEKVTHGIAKADYVITFLNEEATRSEWVLKELESAFEREDALGRPFVLPVLLGGFRRESIPEKLQEKLGKDRRFLTYQGSSYPRIIATFANELTDELFRLVCSRPVLAAEGMATVYFFNFIELLFKKTQKAGELQLERSNKDRQTVDPRQIQLCVVLPDSLGDDLNEIRTTLRLQDGVLWEGENWIFKVSHRDRQDPEAGRTIIFYDVPNILTPAARFYDFAKFDDQGHLRLEWVERTKLELKAFKIRLENLVGTLPSKTASRIKILAASEVAS